MNNAPNYHQHDHHHHLILTEPSLSPSEIDADAGGNRIANFSISFDLVQDTRTQPTPPSSSSSSSDDRPTTAHVDVSASPTRARQIAVGLASRFLSLPPLPLTLQQAFFDFRVPERIALLDTRNAVTSDAALKQILEPALASPAKKAKLDRAARSDPYARQVDAKGAHTYNTWDKAVLSVLGNDSNTAPVRQRLTMGSGKMGRVVLQIEVDQKLADRFIEPLENAIKAADLASAEGGSTPSTSYLDALHATVFEQQGLDRELKAAYEGDESSAVQPIVRRLLGAANRIMTAFDPDSFPAPSLPTRSPLNPSLDSAPLAPTSASTASPWWNGSSPGNMVRPDYISARATLDVKQTIATLEKHVRNLTGSAADATLVVSDTLWDPEVPFQPADVAVLQQSMTRGPSDPWTQSSTSYLVQAVTQMHTHRRPWGIITDWDCAILIRLASSHLIKLSLPFSRQGDRKNRFSTLMLASAALCNPNLDVNDAEAVNAFIDLDKCRSQINAWRQAAAQRTTARAIRAKVKQSVTAEEMQCELPAAPPALGGPGDVGQMEQGSASALGAPWGGLGTSDGPSSRPTLPLSSVQIDKPQPPAQRPPPPSHPPPNAQRPPDPHPPPGNNSSHVTPPRRTMAPHPAGSWAQMTPETDSGHDGSPVLRKQAPIAYAGAGHGRALVEVGTELGPSHMGVHDAQIQVDDVYLHELGLMQRSVRTDLTVEASTELAERATREFIGGFIRAIPIRRLHNYVWEELNYPLAPGLGQSVDGLPMANSATNDTSPTNALSSPLLTPPVSPRLPTAIRLTRPETHGAHTVAFRGEMLHPTLSDPPVDIVAKIVRPAAWDDPAAYAVDLDSQMPDLDAISPDPELAESHGGSRAVVHEFEAEMAVYAATGGIGFGRGLGHVPRLLGAYIGRDQGSKGMGMNLVMLVTEYAGREATKQERVVYAKEILAAFNTLWEHGWVHGDVAPRHIRLQHTAHGTQIRLIDFGRARAADAVEIWAERRAVFAEVGLELDEGCDDDYDYDYDHEYDHDNNEDRDHDSEYDHNHDMDMS